MLLLLCVSVLSLALVTATPGDYFDSARVNPQVSSQALRAMRAEHALDKPFPILYWRWLRSAANGDWGYSLAYNTAAGPILWPRARNTLLLALLAMLLAWMIALPAGIAAAARRGGWADLLASGFTAFLLGVPEVVLALGVLLIAAHSRFPFIGTELEPAESLRSLFLPTICLAAGLLPLLVLHIRNGVGEALDAPFVTAARSLGIGHTRILLRWVLPAALNSMISLFGLSLGLLMSSSLVVEGVFGWPGLGQLMLQAIRDRDIFLIVDSAMIAAAFLVLGNLAADLLLYASDPRIRTK